MAAAVKAVVVGMADTVTVVVPLVVAVASRPRAVAGVILHGETTDVIVTTTDVTVQGAPMETEKWRMFVVTMTSARMAQLAMKLRVMKVEQIREDRIG